MNSWMGRKFLFLYKYAGKWISRLINQKRRKKEYCLQKSCVNSTLFLNGLKRSTNVEDKVSVNFM
mgnify:CR=1 FL=1